VVVVVGVVVLLAHNRRPCLGTEETRW